MSRDYFAGTNRRPWTINKARAILPILVQRVQAARHVQVDEDPEIKITYEALGNEIDAYCRNLNYPLGCIGDILSEMNEQREEDIPPIQGLVVNKGTGLPGESFHCFRHNPSPQEKEEIFSEVLVKIRNYPMWLEVLEELGLSLPESLNL